MHRAHFCKIDFAADGSKSGSLVGCEAEEALPATRFGLITCIGLWRMLRDELDLAIVVKSILSSNPVALVARFSRRTNNLK